MTPDRNAVLTENWSLLRWATQQVHKVHPDAEYDDLLQDIALRVVRGFHRYRPERGSLSVWVRRVALGVAIRRRQFARRKCRHPRRVRPLEGLPDPAARPVEPDDGPAIGPRVLEAALSQLHPDHRRAVVFWFGLGGNEPRKLADIDPGLTRQGNRHRVDTAIRRLREIIYADAARKAVRA